MVDPVTPASQTGASYYSHAQHDKKIRKMVYQGAVVKQDNYIKPLLSDALMVQASFCDAAITESTVM